MAAAACTGGGSEKGRNCGGPPPPLGGGITAAGGGTPTPVPTIEIALPTTSGGMIVVPAEGDTAAITFAPQGGYIVLAGIRARGFDECVEITAAIRDPLDGGAIVSLEQRPAQLEDGGDGWLYPHLPVELFNWANLPACQAGIFTRDFHGEPYVFEIVADDGAVTSSVTRELVPWCAFDDDFCVETCSVTTSLALAR